MGSLLRQTEISFKSIEEIGTYGVEYEKEKCHTERKLQLSRSVRVPATFGQILSNTVAGGKTGSSIPLCLAL